MTNARIHYELIAAVLKVAATVVLIAFLVLLAAWVIPRAFSGDDSWLVGVSAWLVGVSVGLFFFAPFALLFLLSFLFELYEKLRDLKNGPRELVGNLRRKWVATTDGPHSKVGQLWILVDDNPFKVGPEVFNRVSVGDPLLVAYWDRSELPGRVARVDRLAGNGS